MKIQFMRKIDYYLGIPVCFLCTLWYKLATFLKNKATVSKPVDSIVFMKFLGIGSIVLTLPAIKKAQELFPTARLFFLTFRGNERLGACVNVLHNVEFLSIDTSTPWRFIASYLHTISALRKQKTTVCIDFEFFSRFSALTAFLIRSEDRLGFCNLHMEGLYRGDFLTHKITYNHYQHTATAFMTMVLTLKNDQTFPTNKFMPLPISSLPTEQIHFEISQPEAASILSKFSLTPNQHFLLINPNCSEGFLEVRKWPLEYFVTVVQAILALESPPIIGIIGTQAEQHYSEKLTRMISHSAIRNWAGKTSLQELLVLMQHARVLLTNDSGPAHLAALTDTPIITLFGPETPLLYAPLSKHATNLYRPLGCSPCVTIYNGKNTACDDNICLQGISPEVVIGALQQYL